jgi:hypothetical protein
MMEKSSRFLSLSGLSGVSAGMVAMVGAFLAYRLIGQATLLETDTSPIEIKTAIGTDLFLIALGTLGLAILLIFLFTYRKSQKLKLPVWTSASRRLIYHLAVPLLTGGFFILKIVDLGYWGLIAPGCLLFYGLSLVNASRYTIGDIGVLGMIEIGLGLLNLLFIQQGLLFWTLGFGLAHIVYGVYMWNKYDKN